MAPFETLYGGPCRSLGCWVEGQEPILVGPELIQQTQRGCETDTSRTKIDSANSKSL